MSTVLAALGKKIRMYRKANGLSLEELAAKVFKSKASISKYELGKTSIDILTLMDIAGALDVTLHQLLEIDAQHEPIQSTNHPFGRTNQLYLYHRVNKDLYTSLMRFGPADQTGLPFVTLYYQVGSLKHIEKCRTIYHGHMYNHDMVISFFLHNYHNTMENVFLTASIPMNNTSVMTGMICGLNEALTPVARKIILSREPIKEGPELINAVSLTAKSIRDVKKTNSLTIIRETTLT